MTLYPDTAYRPNVGLALFSARGEVLLGRRRQGGAFAWQMPQGGIDSGETPEQAALRELEEEIGVGAHLVELLEETPDWLRYDFPDYAQRRGNWRGQRQKWFALRYRGTDHDIVLDRHTPEFDSWRWADLAQAPSLIIDFKRAVYEQIARRFAVWAKPG
jgi:putative (di)nucleoside polyphosphate hydrolase